MEKTDFTDRFVKPAFVGLAAGLGAMYLVGSDPIPVMGMDISPFLLVGGSAALGNVASGYLSHYALAKLSGGNPSRALSEERIVVPLLTGVSTYAAVALATGSTLSMMGAMELAGLGAAAHVSGSYGYDILYPMVSLPGFKTSY
jgi:hypothetical protein